MHKLSSSYALVAVARRLADESHASVVHMCKSSEVTNQTKTICSTNKQTNKQLVPLVVGLAWFKYSCQLHHWSHNCRHQCVAFVCAQLLHSS